MDSNELLSKVLAENIQKASDGVGSAIDFTMDQAPEVIQQAIMWQITKSVTAFIISISALLFGVYLLQIARGIQRKNKERKLTRYHSDEFEDADGYFIISACIIFFAAPFALMSCMSALKVWVAPKVWLIEYAASLIK